MTKKSEHSRHLPEDRTIKTIHKNRGKIGGGGSFFRDFRTSLGGPLSFRLSLSLMRLHWTLYHPPGRCTSRHRVKSGRAIISPLTAFEVYILSRHLQASRERREQGRSFSLALLFSRRSSLEALLLSHVPARTGKRE